MTPEVCPNCGADVPRRAKACPECGSSEETGWSEDAVTGDLGIPDDHFDYDEFVKKEFQQRRGRHGLKWYWVAAAALLLLGFGYMMLGRFL